ncbi:MAG: hypothetical protein AAGJ74_10375 [Pseudomonadota bacterium]
MSRMIALVALAAYVIGTLWSLLSGHSEFMQRFGSLGVAASILFFTDRLLEIELSRQRAVERMLHEYGIRFEAVAAGLPPADLPDTGYETDFLAEEGEFQRLRDRSARIQAGNIFLLTVATLQWGFGDIFLQWANP